MYLAMAYLFLYLPLIVLGIQSVNSSRFGTRWEGFTLQWYGRILDSPQLVDAALNSLGIAVASATLATALGTLGAIALYRYRFRGRRALRGLLLTVVIAPDIVMGISLLVLFIVLHLTLGFLTLLLAHVTFCLPFVAVTVYSRLAGFDPRLLEAARDLGAGEWRTVLEVVLPLAAPAVAAGWLLSLTLSLDDVIVSFFVTGPTFDILPLRIYSMVRLGVKPEVNALAMVLFAVPLVLVILSQLLLKERPR
jgi:spermidine/putrescine transport system permease protein